MTRIAGEAGLVRTHELFLCGLQNEANLEWRVATDALTPTQRPQTVRLASNWGWHLQAIATAARQGMFKDYELLYPRPYDPEVRQAASATRLPDSLIYAVIRQESLYRADAGSNAGALGLMQLLPETARRTARKAGLKTPTRSDLLLPSVNVPLGSAFLRSLLDRADGQLPLAIAGYNAGPSAARRWLSLKCDLSSVATVAVCAEVRKPPQIWLSDRLSPSQIHQSSIVKGAKSTNRIFRNHSIWPSD